jgi:hypothetical protein
MSKPQSWQDIFDHWREHGFGKMPWLPGPFEPTGYYLEQLQEAIVKVFKPGEWIPAIESLPYGILLGDVVVQRFGAHWQYAEFTPGRMTSDQIYAHEVQLADNQGAVFTGSPMRRVAKFVHNPAKSLTSWYDSFDTAASGNFDVERLTTEGFIETSPESVALYRIVEGHEPPPIAIKKPELIVLDPHPHRALAYRDQAEAAWPRVEEDMARLPSNIPPYVMDALISVTWTFYTVTDVPPYAVVGLEDGTHRFVRVPDDCEGRRVMKFMARLGQKQKARYVYFGFESVDENLVVLFANPIVFHKLTAPITAVGLGAWAIETSEPR